MLKNLSAASDKTGAAPGAAPRCDRRHAIARRVRYPVARPMRARPLATRILEQE